MAENDVEKKGNGNTGRTILGIILGLCSLCILAIVGLFLLGLSGFHLRVEANSVVEKPQPQVIIVEKASPTIEVREVQVVPEAEVTCGYDYALMPTGKDANGVSLADKGISLNGKITGPAIVQVDKGTIVVIYPGKTWSGVGTAWKYDGNIKCLEAQIQFFPNKEVIKIK